MQNKNCIKNTWVDCILYVMNHVSVLVCLCWQDLKGRQESPMKKQIQ